MNQKNFVRKKDPFLFLAVVFLSKILQAGARMHIVIKHKKEHHLLIIMIMMMMMTKILIINSFEWKHYCQNTLGMCVLQLNIVANFATLSNLFRFHFLGLLNPDSQLLSCHPKAIMHNC